MNVIIYSYLLLNDKINPNPNKAKISSFTSYFEHIPTHNKKGKRLMNAEMLFSEFDKSDEK